MSRLCVADFPTYCATTGWRPLRHTRRANRKEEYPGRLENNNVIVTGGAHGIGRAICELFAREGAAVAVSDIIDDEVQGLVGKIKDAGGKATFWHLGTPSEEKRCEGVYRPIVSYF